MIQNETAPYLFDRQGRLTLRDGQNLDFQDTVRAISSRIDLGTLAEDYASRIDHDNAGMTASLVYHPTGSYLFAALESSRQVAVLSAVSGQAVNPTALRAAIDELRQRALP